MTEGLFSSGELAKKVGVNKETIRFYERTGLLETPIRFKNGYRKFTQNDLDKLQFIHGAKQLGFSLKQIQDLISLEEDSNSKCSTIKVKAQNKLDEIKKRISSLNKIKLALEKVISKCEVNQPVEKCEILNSIKGYNYESKK